MLVCWGGAGGCAGDEVDALWQEARMDGKGLERAMAVTRECPDMADRQAASARAEVEEFWFHLPPRA